MVRTQVGPTSHMIRCLNSICMRFPPLKSTSQVQMGHGIPLQRHLDLIHGILRIPEEHTSPWHGEQGIRYVCVPAGHSSLHYNCILTVPNFQDWHTGDRGVRLKRYWVDCVVRADDNCQVRIGEVVVDFVHLKDNCTICQHIHFATLGERTRKEQDSRRQNRNAARTYYHKALRLRQGARYIALAYALRLGEWRTGP